MQQRSVIERVEILERTVEVLERLPERVTGVELQLVQLRDEMRAEFSAMRAEMRAGDEETRRTLRDEVRTVDEQTRRYMRVLHEEVISRLAVLHEGRRSPRRKRQQ